jgi:hypothetical protein
MERVLAGNTIILGVSMFAYGYEPPMDRETEILLAEFNEEHWFRERPWVILHIHSKLFADNQRRLGYDEITAIETGVQGFENIVCTGHHLEAINIRYTIDQDEFGALQGKMTAEHDDDGKMTEEELRQEKKDDGAAEKVARQIRTCRAHNETPVGIDQPDLAGEPGHGTQTKINQLKRAGRLGETDLFVAQNIFDGRSEPSGGPQYPDGSATYIDMLAPEAESNVRRDLVKNFYTKIDAEVNGLHEGFISRRGERPEAFPPS